MSVWQDVDFMHLIRHTYIRLLGCGQETQQPLVEMGDNNVTLACHPNLWLLPFDCFLWQFSLQCPSRCGGHWNWGCWEPRADKCSPFKAWSRSEYSRVCQKCLPCPNFYLPGPFTYIFSRSSPYLLIALVLANAVSRVGPAEENGYRNMCYCALIEGWFFTL